MPSVMRLRWLSVGEGDQPPEIALDEGEACAVENADDGERDEQRRDGAGLDGEEADVEAQHGVEAELAGDHHGERDGRFAEGVGEPAVQREDGHLDREGKEECERAPEERAGGDERRWRCSSWSSAKLKVPVRA